MSTTSNLVAAATLTSAAFIGGALLLSPGEGVAPEAGIVDAGPPAIGRFYLRFPDEQAWLAVAKDAGLWRRDLVPEAFCDRWGTDYMDGGTVDAGCISRGQRFVPGDAGHVVAYTHSHSVDVVGRIVRPVGDGGTEEVEGWHVNYSGILPEAWVQYIVEPENPVRRFWGE